jgi:hypothetical protein
LPVPELLVSVTWPPVQKVVAPEGVMAGAAGGAFAVTEIATDSAEQPLMSVCTTV